MHPLTSPCMLAFLSHPHLLPILLHPHALASHPHLLPPLFPLPLPPPPTAGLAHTFFCASMDKPRAGELINVLREAEQVVPEDLLKFGTAVKKKESKMYGAHFKDVDVAAKATKMTFDSDDE